MDDREPTLPKTTIWISKDHTIEDWKEGRFYRVPFEVYDLTDPHDPDSEQAQSMLRGFVRVPLQEAEHDPPHVLARQILKGRVYRLYRRLASTESLTHYHGMGNRPLD